MSGTNVRIRSASVNRPFCSYRTSSIFFVTEIPPAVRR